jgi:DNA repair protein RadC
MSKTLIFEELKQISIREIHTYSGCDDVSAVGIPVTDEVAKRNLVCPSRKQRGRLIPKPQAALRPLQHKLRHEDKLLTG